MVALLAVASCTPQTGRETPELARNGSISRGTGALVPLSLCQRGMRVVAASRVAPSLSWVGNVCGAARGL